MPPVTIVELNSVHCFQMAVFKSILVPEVKILNNENMHYKNFINLFSFSFADWNVAFKGAWKKESTPSQTYPSSISLEFRCKARIRIESHCHSSNTHFQC